METQIEKNSEIYEVIQGDFSLPATGEISLDEIRRMLVYEIGILLDKNPEKLFSILYRIDIPQRVTDEIFAVNNKEDIPPLLSEAIIQRQIQKINTRKLYKNK